IQRGLRINHAMSAVAHRCFLSRFQHEWRAFPRYSAPRRAPRACRALPVRTFQMCRLVLLADPAERQMHARVAFCLPRDLIERADLSDQFRYITARNPAGDRAGDQSGGGLLCRTGACTVIDKGLSKRLPVVQISFDGAVGPEPLGKAIPATGLARSEH